MIQLRVKCLRGVCSYGSSHANKTDQKNGNYWLLHPSVLVIL